ncbi:MAG: HD domain-containing protein [Maribacter sp.]|nr:HD domain-containing protein [Maribacter sp.]NNK19544.1 HD domain-containing protein [Maribacter sp.]
MKDQEIIDQTIAFVQKTLQNAEGGHDWHHTQRVFMNSRHIAESENTDPLVVSLGALLHDIADAKFYDGDETVGPKLAKEFLESIGVDSAIITHVVNIINHISFKNSLSHDGFAKFNSKELQVVQDADRLDAIGAIGIARAFNYGGFKNRELYNPEIAPNLDMTKEEYKISASPTLNHFYEKLLLLKDKMNTPTGKKMAEERHDYMQDFLAQFFKEWNGKL